MTSRAQYYCYKKGSYDSVRQGDWISCTYRTWIWEDDPLTENDDSQKILNYFMNHIITKKQQPVEEEIARICIGKNEIHPFIEEKLVGQSIGNAVLFYLPSEMAFGDLGFENEKGEKIIEPNADLLIEIKIFKIEKEKKKNMGLGNIVLGSFPFAGVFSSITRDEKKNILSGFINNGGVYIHSSIAYGKGKTEEELGQLLAELIKEGKIKKNSYKIIACCGWHVNEDGGCARSGKREDVLDCFLRASKNFASEYIDVFMSHLPDPSTSYRETIDAMAKLKKDGKIGAICLSNVTLEQLKEYNYNNDVDYIQQRYSYINRSLDNELLKYCQEHKIKIMAYQVLERGLLTDKFLKNVELAEGDLRSKKPEFQEGAFAEIVTFVKDRLLPIAVKKGCSVQELIVAWTLAKIDLPLIGISKEKYIEQYKKATGIELTSEEFRLLEEEYNRFEIFIESNYHMTIRELIRPDF